jgi:hypothetical protein
LLRRKKKNSFLKTLESFKEREKIKDSKRDKYRKLVKDRRSIDRMGRFWRGSLMRVAPTRCTKALTTVTCKYLSFRMSKLQDKY